MDTKEDTIEAIPKLVTRPSAGTIDGDAKTCPVEAVTLLIGGKWKPVIMYHLIENGVMRFGELRRASPGVTQKMLTKQLRELEKDGLVNRTVYPEVPPKVEYALTDLGQSLAPIIQNMRSWGAQYYSQLGT